MSANFHYVPLNAQLREIRLLTVSSGDPDDILHCSLSTTSLNTHPTYNALSYVWGDPATSNISGNILILDGHPVPVTANLLSALRHLRAPLAEGMALSLWVDAVCINQGNLDERSQQVAMMRDIYSSAHEVIIWLGEADDESDAAFGAIPEIANRRQAAAGESPEDKQRLDLMRECSSFFFGLADRRPWFSRVWILQELAMAQQDPLVVCGWKSAPWSMLMKAWKAIAKETFTEIGMVRPKPRDNSLKDPEAPSTGEHTEEQLGDGDDVEILAMLKIDVLNDLRQAMRSRGGESLRKLVMISKSSESTDPRDRIYSLLGLLGSEALDPNLSVIIPVDYRKPTSAVYADAMAHIFSRAEGPYFLSGIFLPGVAAAAPRISYLPPTTEQPNLPSWVPDFSRQTAEKAAQPSGISFHPPAFMSASGAGAVCQNGRRLDDSRTLQVEGLLVDTIEEVIPLGETLDECIKNLPYLESVSSEARGRPCQFGPTIAPLMEQFKTNEPLWRILISNKHFMSGYDAAPSSYEEIHLSLMNPEHGTNLGVEDPSQDDPKVDVPNEYEQSLKQAIGKRSLLTTRSGFVGTGVPDSRKGDIIAILFGSPAPFVLRPGTEVVQVAGNEMRTHLLIGASYIGGIMGGEMVDELYCEDLMDSTTFFIQ